MKILKQIFCTFFFTFLLSACGGGSSGDTSGNSGSTPNSGGNSNPAGDWLTFSPAQVDITAYEGESLAVNVIGTATKTFTKNFNVAIIDSVGVITPNTSVSAITQMQYRVTLNSNPSLKPGVYSSNIQARLCEDDPKVCNAPFPGSPWNIPYKITVQSNTNLSNLKVLPQVSSWSTFQGNAAHTNYVPASFYPSNFSRRWNWTPEGGGYLSDISIENGVIFLNKRSATYPSGVYELTALKETNGEVLWKTPMGRLSKANAPAAGSSKVFVTSTGHEDTFFWVFDQANGSLLNKLTMHSQWETYLAPTVYGNEVFTESGYFGGMSKYNINEQKISWAISLPQYDTWSPAVDANFAYTYLSGSLHAVSKTDGKLAYTIKNPDFSWAGYKGATPVLSEKNVAYVVSNGLQAFDLTKQTRAWSVTGNIYGALSYAKDVVYILNASGTVLEARSAQNGSLIWMASALSSDNIALPYKDMVVTDNIVFISRFSSTLAIDTKTRKVVWEHPFGGSLAISDRGVLYIKGESRIEAINLQ